MGSGFQTRYKIWSGVIREMSTRYAFGKAGSDVRRYWDIEMVKQMLENVRIGDADDDDVLYLDYRYTFKQITCMVQRIKANKVFLLTPSYFLSPAAKGRACRSGISGTSPCPTLKIAHLPRLAVSA